MQVYRDLRIITARPTPAEEARAPHRLYGHVDAAENYSVGRWCVDAAAALAEARQAGQRADRRRRHRPLFQGADAGLAAVPPIPADDPRDGARRGSRPRASRRSMPNLRGAIPPAAPRLMPGDRSRITRALEVVLATGRSLADWHRDGMPPALDAARAVKIFLAAERARALPPYRRALRRHARAPARSTKCGRSPRAVSIRRCRR